MNPETLSIKPKATLPKIELSGPLRVRIENYIKKLHADLSAAPIRKIQLEKAVLELQDLSGQLTADIELLKPQAVRSDDAAGRLHAKETRLREVNLELLKTRQILENLRPMTF